MSRKDGPTALDFSEATARRAAFSETIQHPLTMAPAAGGLVVAVGVGLFSIVSAPAAIAIGVGGLVIGGAHFAFRFLGGGEALMQKYYDNLHAEFKRMKDEKSAQLAQDLERLGCERGQEQVTQLEAKFNNLVAVFDRVFSRAELTYSRFVGTAEQGYRAGLENLERVVVLLTNIDDIDRTDVGRRIKMLEKKTFRTSPDEKSLAALQQQAKVFDQTQEEVEDLLAVNEEALATMDQAGAAAVRVKDRSATTTPQESMKESLDLLQEMIERANRKKGPALTLDSEPQKP